MHPRIALALVCLAGTVVGQSSWFSPTLAVNPPPRDTHEMATEPISGLVYLFGGVRDHNAGQLNDTWTWDGQAWTQLTSSVTPDARESFILVADGSGGVVLFGGYSFTSGLLNDTWTYAQGQWQTENPLSRPSPRRYHAGACTGHSVLMFGGSNVGTSAYYNDTWEWTSGNWVQRSPATVPFGRHSHELAFDSARSRVVMFGGNAGSNLSDTWEWNGNDWTRLFPATSPPARNNNYMAYHDGIHRTVVYGGVSSAGTLADCWTWDGATWSQVVFVGPTPGPRVAPMAYSPASSGLVLFGVPSPGYQSNTWISLPPVPATFATFGSGCAGSGGTPSLSQSTLPVAGQTFTMSLTNLPSVAVVVGLLGLSNSLNSGALGSFPLPRDYTPLGMPGCTQYVSDDATVFLLGLAGQTNWSIPIPAAAGLVGFTFHVQAAVFDQAANAFGVAVTNAGMAQVGS
jgi:hypothetical protein